MAKHCWFCKNTEDFFLAQKNELLKIIDQKLLDCKKIEDSIIEITKEKLGFSDISMEKVKSIPKVYSEMTLNAVLENKDNFIKLEPNLNIVLDYCMKYGKRNCKTVNEVIEFYLLEPIESRYCNELRQNEIKRNQLLQRKQKLEGIKTFFIEKEITPTRLDNELQKLKRKPAEYNRVIASPIAKVKKVKLDDVDENKNNICYSELGFNFSKKIFICPVCLSLFAEAANASFDILEAQRKAQNDAEMSDWYDDDYDDDYDNW